MVRTISSTEAKNHFGSIVDEVRSGKGDVIVENRGQPLFAIIPISKYENLERLEKEERRKKAVETLRRLRKEIQAQNPDMTEELADELANRASNDIVEAIARKFKTPVKV